MVEVRQQWVCVLGGGVGISTMSLLQENFLFLMQFLPGDGRWVWDHAAVRSMYAKSKARFGPWPQPCLKIVHVQDPQKSCLSLDGLPFYLGTAWRR